MAGVIFGFDADDPEVFDSNPGVPDREPRGPWILFGSHALPGNQAVRDAARQSRITTYDWSKYDGATAVFLPKMMTAEQCRKAPAR